MVLVTNQWVVSMHGDSLVHCVEALLKYRNAVSMGLAATVTGEIRTPVVENTGPLIEVVMRREKDRRFGDKVQKVGWMLVGAAASIVLGLLVNALIGG